MRERTPLTKEILQQLSNLKLIASTGPRNASIDRQTAAALGIAVTATGYDSTPTIEFTWSLILASIRGIDREAAWFFPSSTASYCLVALRIRAPHIDDRGHAVI